jgi:predicted CXXCH cytochrome family protein
MDAAFVLLALAGATFALARAARGWARWLLAIAMPGAGTLALPMFPSPARSDAKGAPGETPRGEYVSSDACRSCHPREHATWHASHHRTMTRAARASTARARMDGTQLALDGRAYTLSTRGDELWATLPDLDALADAEREERADAAVPTVERRLLLATGSHRYEGFWVAGRREGELRMLPFVYLLSEGVWMPRRDVFLQPPGAPQHNVRWNSNCIQCHAVAGRPRHDARLDRFDTETVELGIACEACHGPGGEHVRAYASPLARYRRRGEPGADPTIVQPARLSAERSAAVCGQCHAYAFPKDEEDWWQNGYARAFRPGAPLEASRTLIALSKDGPELDTTLESIFWPDGSVRVGGREYNGMVLSKCFTEGHGDRKITCTSCHAMHESDPAGQLDRRLPGDESCLRCHESMRGRAAQHTRHREGSSGAACVACHMPRTSYALLQGMRSHRIDVPRARAAAETGRPTACNLCHIDRSLGWARDQLAAGWRAERSTLAPAEERESAVVAALLRGDAAQRVLAAAAMGDPEALAASGRGWQVPLLAQALLDPYAALRVVALRSLRAQPGFEDLAVTALADEASRRALREEVLRRWESAPHAPGASGVRLGSDGRVDRAALAEMVAGRDDRAVTIAE